MLNMQLSCSFKHCRVIALMVMVGNWECDHREPGFTHCAEESWQKSGLVLFSLSKDHAHGLTGFTSRKRKGFGLISRVCAMNGNGSCNQYCHQTQAASDNPQLATLLFPALVGLS